MNWAQAQADYDRMRPLLRSYWDRLTDADLDEVAGDRARLVGRVADRYALDAAAAHRAVCAFEKDVRLPGAVR
jgi:hypothetical protein